MSENNNWIRH
nr:unnamed protein product [Callosobruchus analis]CAI5849768.1 unnamed protein product [Callosobruchus analis]CAI5853616.1 unnamed protein product [Callosobruchus analis]CAI5857870.1 unnamed protein product [Callosobruchus analis]CAI5863357.1 unnamed protein product [Callosobruchus analis]